MGSLNIFQSLNIVQHKASKKQRSYIIVLVLLAACLASYSNCLNSPFAFDAHRDFIEVKARNPALLAQYFIHDAFPEGRGQYYSYCRPLEYTIITICYQFFKEHPFGYHLIGLGLFVVACFLIYRMLLLVGCDWQVASLTALLYAIHPINTSLLNLNTTITLTLQVIGLEFSVITFFFAQRDTKHVVHYTILSIFAFIIALMCHETSLALPIYLMIMFTLTQRAQIKRILFACLPHCVIALSYLLYRIRYANFQEEIFDQIPVFNLTLPQYIASFASLIAWYLSKLLSLTNIVIKWVVPITTQNVLVWNLLFFYVASICCLIIRHHWKKSHVSLGLLWFLAGFAPLLLGCLSYPNQRALVLELHWFSFSSIGFFLLIALFLHFISQHIKKPLYVALLISIVALNISSTRHYNYLWQDEVRYCRYWVKNIPNAVTTVFLAHAYKRRGDYAAAKKHYLVLLRRNPDQWKFHLYLAQLAIARGDFDEAEKYYLSCLEHNPDSGTAYNDLGVIAIKRGNFEKARTLLKKSIECESYRADARLNLALMHYNAGEQNKALALYENAALADYKNEKALYMTTLIYLRKGNHAKALEIGEKALDALEDPASLTSLGSFFASSNFYAIAGRYYSKALTVDANWKDAYRESGKLFANAGQFDKAAEMWQAGLRIDPNDQELRGLMNLLEHQRKAMSGATPEAPKGERQ